ncbi:MAG: hypothetical protein HFJ18_03850 [Clostridia bacterium]|nr:hypothetical protein [Clostridia bacterium]
MESKKKILIIVAIVLVIIIALAGTVAGMVMTGKIAITTRQKIAKGLSDIGNEISELEGKSKEQEKLMQTPFESETTITGKVNKMELNNTNGMEEILKELENVVNNTKITNTLKADLKNNIINEKISVNLADIIEEISADVEYNNDRISLKSKELNDKYITFTKSDIEGNDQYEEYTEIFDIFAGICKREISSLYLTDEEKDYFAENYQGIFSEYITDDMLREEKISIVVDGQKKECNNINFTLNKNQIVELVGRCLKKFEGDEKGKQIIISKFQSVVSTFGEEDLKEMIENLKYRILYLEDNTTMKISLYCTMFKTYGFSIEFYSNNDENYIVDLTLGKKEENLKISTKQREILKAKKTKDRIELSIIGEGENSVVVVIKTNGTQKTATLEINDVQDNVKIIGTLTNEQITKTANENESKNTIQIVLQVEDDNMDITLNIDTNLKYVNSIEEIEYTDTNSINIITAEQAEVQQYLTEVKNNSMALVVNATQNSKLIEKIYEVITLYNSMKETSQNQSAQTFNNMFRVYIGIRKGSEMKTLLNQVLTSNSLHKSHQVAVSIVEGENTLVNAITNPEEIKSAMDKIGEDNEYQVLVTSVNEEGYVTGIEIRKQ